MKPWRGLMKLRIAYLGTKAVVEFHEIKGDSNTIFSKLKADLGLLDEKSGNCFKLTKNDPVTVELTPPAGQDLPKFIQLIAEALHKENHIEEAHRDEIISFIKGIVEVSRIKVRSELLLMNFQFQQIWWMLKMMLR